MARPRRRTRRHDRWPLHHRHQPGLVADLAGRLAAYLAAHTPPGRAGTRAAEAALARACVVLTDLESAYRGGWLTDAAAARWADGDLLTPTDPASHGGTTLLDVKTVASVRDPHRVGRWLWQLLTYAWLDTSDRLHVRAVGLYLARHGVVATWSLPS